jgi:hypothetical protein
MLMFMRPISRLLVCGAVAAVALVACKPAAPVAEQKPRRKSFEESGGWQPSAPAQAPAGSSGTGSVQQQAGQVQSTWDQARQTNDEAERQRLANQALQQTRSMADQPSSTPPQ